MGKAVIVVPVYKEELNAYERLSLECCIRQFADSYPIVFVLPNRLKDCPTYQNIHPNCSTITFADTYFANIAGYNALMLSIAFYQQFSAYTHMLVYQLDAYVFHNNLETWMAKGYDYIGAPAFFGDDYDKLTSQEATAYQQALENNRLVYNGGLSLRKISAMIRFLRIYNVLYPKWKGNEDKLFSLDATRLFPLKPFIKLPDWKTALAFSIERSPAASYALLNNQLPFGCHAWERYDIAFWKSHINGLETV